MKEKFQPLKKVQLRGGFSDRNGINKLNTEIQLTDFDYCLVDGLHEGIVDEELWTKAHEKRQETGVKSESKYGKERAHLLTGIIKCPKCGSGMYANRVCWTKKDGTYKEVMYYACSRNK